MNETSERMLEKRARQRGTQKEFRGELRANKVTSRCSNKSHRYLFELATNNITNPISADTQYAHLVMTQRLSELAVSENSGDMRPTTRAMNDSKASLSASRQIDCSSDECCKCIITTTNTTRTTTTNKTKSSEMSKLLLRSKRRRPSGELDIANNMRQWFTPLLATATCLLLVIASHALAWDSQQQATSGRRMQADWHRTGYLKDAGSLRGLRVQRDTTLDPSSAALVAPTGVHQVGTCGYPGSPAHASVTFNTTQVVAGTAASYTCDNGYELLGPPRRLCQANGTWSPVGIPFCVLNVGLGKAAMQSSTAGHGSAQKAVDGSTSPYFQTSTCTMTDVEQNPWWYVNLLEPYLVQIVRIDFGTACCANRQKATIAVRVGNHRPDQGNNQLCNRYQGFIEEGKPLFLPCTRPAAGAFVSIHLESPKGSSLSICETFIYTDHALSIEQCPSFRDQPLGSTATYNGKCYLFHNNQALNFDSARKYCESRGGSLVDETSPALQGFLSWELYRRHRNDQVMGQYWLGAVRDARQPQNWKWINGKDVQISFWSSPVMQNNCSRFDGSKGWLWSDSDCQQQYNFICQYRPLSCGRPEKPTNSTLTTKNVDNGTVIEYQCAPGNLLMGPKSRACLPTGFFSEFAPKCKYLDCQFPAMIPNGDYKLLNGTTSYQSIVNYYCDKGFQLYGKATLACDVDERWNGPPPRCEPLLCPAPVPPTNGYVTVTSNVTVPGAQATYDCRPGYELVGDRLLTCSLTGSWDYNFPYCRERRLPPVPQILPANVIQIASTTVAPAVSSRPSSPVSRQQQQQVLGTMRPSNTVQFPTADTPFASNRIATSAASSTTSTTTTTTASPPPTNNNNNLPASLNGLAGQFIPPQPQPAPVPVPISPQLTSQTPASSQPPIASTESVLFSTSTASSESPILQQTRKVLNQFSLSPLPVPEIAIASIPQVQPTSQTQQPPVASSTQQPPRPQFRPNGGASAATSPQSQFASFQNAATSATQSGQQQQQQQQQSIRQQQTTTTANNNNKFSDSRQTATTSQVSYDSIGPLATSNSISIHPQQQQPTTIVHGNTTGSSPLSNHHLLTGSGQNVLASFNPPVRAHANLASAKYSLDGIIAVAIFGGFIFLGAIITIIVIIIRRRKSGHSSSIDAQTISTYDSNGDTHNGLYRNYQQAWENLRFATPSSQPKSSGAGLVSGPPVGLKNFGSPAAVAMATHQAHLQHAHLLAHGSNGHHNLAMSGSGSTSSGSSSLGAGGVDPLLAPHSHHVHHSHAHHMQQRRSALMNDDDDEDDLGEQGVLASDEIPPGAGRISYGRHSASLDHHGTGTGEGFRDSDELTINAEVATNGQRRSQQLFATNSIGRRPNSMNITSVGQNDNAESRHRQHRQHGHHSHHHHHHHHHAHQEQGVASGSSAGSQHQRLVSSSTPSNSTRSSRASPPSDEHSLEQLAYGNSWHPNAGAANVVAGNSQQDTSSNDQSAGSGASILGNNGRAQMRYN